MTTSFEKQLFDSANAYYEGANILMKPSNLSSSRLLVQPGVTCAALSLKLFLKCILAVEGKDKEDQIYRITELYKAIAPATEKLILDKFDEYSNTRYTSDQLIKHLEALDNAFVKWRYIHEEDAKSVNIEDLEQMLLAAKAAILAIKPQWA